MESEKMTKKQLSTAKASLTREIKSTDKEIKWITRDDNNGRPRSLWYLGELRAPQLGALKTELRQLKAKRAALDVVDYSDRLINLIIRTYGVRSGFAKNQVENYKVFINACALHAIELKDTLIALYRLSNYK